MTALTSVPEIRRGPVPWSQLGWVVWRRYRTTIVAALAAMAAVSAYLLVDGLRMRTAYAAYLDCQPAGSAACQLRWTAFRDGFGQPGLLSILLIVMPGIIGAFAGAPALGRELETGTFRYAWTQGVGRVRWGAAVLIPAAVGLAGLAGLFGVMVAWHDQPLATSGVMPRLRPTSFPVTGVAIAGWALLAFALAVLAGLLWRRVLAGLATAVAVWFGLALLAGNTLRMHYITPLVTDQDLSAGDVTLEQWWTKGGVRVSDLEITNALQAAGFQNSGTGTPAVPAGAAGSIDPVQYLLQHSYQQLTSYQPESRFWTFQWIEAGWLTALSVLLLGAALLLLRRRPS